MRIAVFYCAADTGGWASHVRGGSPEATHLSHALSVLSTRLKSLGHDPYLVDLRSFSGIEQFQTCVRGLKYQVSVIWAGPGDQKNARAVVSCVRAFGPAAPCIAAGPWASMIVGQSPENVNATIQGDADAALPKILERIEAGESYPALWDETGKPVALGDLPEIDRGLFNVEIEKASPPLPLLREPFYTLSVGRPCPACGDACRLGEWPRCLVCCPETGDGAPSRLKTPTDFIGEAYRLASSGGTGGIGSLAIHDTVRAPAAWLRAAGDDWRDLVGCRFPLCLPFDPRAVIEDPAMVSTWAKCGLTWAVLDLGSGDDDLRASLGVRHTGHDILAAAKILAANRVNILVRALVGLPGETEAMSKRTEHFIGAVKAARIDVRTWQPAPGTAIYRTAKSRGLIADESMVEPTGTITPGRPWVRGIDYRALAARLKAWPGAHQVPAQAPPVTFSAQAIAPEPGEERRVKANPALPPAPRGAGLPDDDLRLDVLRQLDAYAANDAADFAAGAPRPKVSVVICTYQRLELLREAFASIEEQTLREKCVLEIVIIDNGNTRPDMVEYLAYKKSAKFSGLRVKVIRHRENVNNIAVGWNVGIQASTGEYVCFLDDDNRKLPEYCERLSAWLDANPDRWAVRCDDWIVNLATGQRTNRRLQPHQRSENLAIEEELRGNWVDSGCLMIRRAFFDRFGMLDERLKACEDWDLVARLVARAGGIGYVDEALTEYRIHNQQRMATSNELGSKACTELLRKKSTEPWEWPVMLLAPSDDRLTASQRQVIAGVRDALGSIHGVRRVDGDLESAAGRGERTRLVLLAAPFMLHGPEVEALQRRIGNFPHKPLLASLHMEDPQAIDANSRMLGVADWVCANDLAAWRHYRAELRRRGDEEHARRVMIWNPLGLTDAMHAGASEEASDDAWDVCVLGYPYPSRAKTVQDFLRHAPTAWRIVLVGDGWEKASGGRIGKNLAFRPTLDAGATARVLKRSKLCLLAHRRQEDIGGFPVHPPESVHRGFLEAALGCVPLIDSDRPFGLGGVRALRYADGKDAATKAWAALKNGDELERLREWNVEAGRSLTMTARVARLILAIKTERYEAWIP